MAVTYSPSSHTAPTTSVVVQNSNSQNITGLSPGRVFTELNDSLAAATIWLPTGTTSDGFPTGMLPFSTGTGTVS